MPAPEARKTPQNARDKDHRYPKIKLRTGRQFAVMKCINLSRNTMTRADFESV